MNIYEEIRSALIDEWQSGATQQEIADRAGVTNPYINNLLSGKRKAAAMKLETLFKLFPQASICLNNGNRTIGSRNKISNSRIQSDDNFFYGSEKLDEVAQAVMSSEKLSAESKVEVYNIIQKLKK